MFCSSCGAPTTTTCKKCGAHIRGEYHVENVYVAGFSYAPPNYCVNCGAPFPWTEAGLAAATKLADELEELPIEERASLKSSLAELTKDSSGTKVAVVRIKKVIGRIGKAAGEALMTLATNIATEAAKKQLGL
jgi:hypothetical protein